MSDDELREIQACEHGRQRRKCEVCQLIASEAENARLTAELASVRANLTATLATENLLADELVKAKRERDELSKSLDWWKEHTEAVEKNWESLVEIARKERDELAARYAGLPKEVVEAATKWTNGGKDFKLEHGDTMARHILAAGRNDDEPKPCPNCRNTIQNATPHGSPELLRCASCKTVFDKLPGIPPAKEPINPVGG